MTEAEWKCLGDYARERADDLGLRDWWVRIEKVSSEEDALASCRVIRGRRLVYIRVCEGFREEKPDEQRSTIIHELLHCHMAAMEWVVSATESALGSSAYAICHEGFTDALEHAVDGIAESIAEKYPLISWPTKPRKK